MYLHPSGAELDGERELADLFTHGEGSQANTTPLALNHTGLFPSVTVSFNLAPDVSLSDATLAIDQMQQRLGMPLDGARVLRGNAAGVSAVAERASRC